MMSAIENSVNVRAITMGYANARVKAMKQSLLTQKETDALAEAGNLDEAYALIEKTQYRQDLVASALMEKSLADQIEMATAKNFSRTLKKIIGFTPKKVRAKIMEMFEKYEVNNIKLILLSKHLGEPKEKIAIFMIETGILPRNSTNRALDAKSVKEAVSAMSGTVYGTVLEKAMRKYEKEKDIAVLASALDEYYYRKLPRIAKNPYGDERLILNMLKAQVDAKNVSTVLRAKKEALKDDKIAEFLIPEGSIPKEKLLQAASAKSVEDAAKHFEKNFGLGKAIEEYRKTGSLIPIEIEAEKAVARKGLGLLRTSVLSIGAIAGFLFLKEEEMANIRKIVRAKEYNLPPERIRGMIVQV